MSRQQALDAIERAHRVLHLTYAELARAITANEATLHRWRSGQSAPTAVFRQRLVALTELMDLLEGAYPDPEHARAWLDRPLAVLRGRTPRIVLEGGRPDLLTGLLLARGAESLAPELSP